MQSFIYAVQKTAFKKKNYNLLLFTWNQSYLGM